MTVRVGLFSRSLRQENPGQAERAARALAERLAPEPSLELFVISAPKLDRGEVLVKAHAAHRYLERVPLDLGRAATGSLPLKERLLPYLQWLYQPPWPRIARRVASLLGLFQWARGYYYDIEAAHGWPVESSHAAMFERQVDVEIMPLRRLDVVVGFGPLEEVWDCPIEHLPTRAICFVHDLMPLRTDECASSPPDRFFRNCAKAVLRARRLVCASRSTEQDLLAFFPNAAGRTAVVHYGHDAALPVAELLATAAAERPYRLLVLGDGVQRVAVRNMLLALALLRRKLPDTSVEVTIAGGSAMRRPLSRLVDAAERHVTIRWIASDLGTNPVEFYRAADAFVYAPLWEGFGLPVLEAMSAGVPVVCSDVASLPEVGGPHARYCDPYNPESIADAIVATLRMTPQEREQWVAAATAWAGAFTWESSAVRLAGIIGKLAAQ